MDMKVSDERAAEIAEREAAGKDWRNRCRHCEAPIRVDCDVTDLLADRATLLARITELEAENERMKGTKP